MSSKKVFVGNLNYDTVENDLKEAFSKAGKVVEAKVVRRGNRSKGYGFVEFETEEDAQKSVEVLDKFDLHDRQINVQLSTSTGEKVGREGGYEGREGGYEGREGGYEGREGGYEGREGGYEGRGGYGREGGYEGRRGYDGDNYDNYDNRPYRNNYRNNYRNDYNSYGRGPSRGRKIYFLRNNFNDNGPRRRNYNNGGRPGGRRNFNNNRPQRPTNTEKIESKTTIFVANLPFSYDDEGLVELFSKCGQIRTAHVVRNKGRSKGFGFVEFESQEGQQNALKTMDNFSVSYKNGEQKVLSVKVAMSELEKKEPQTQTQETQEDDD